MQEPDAADLMVAQSDADFHTLPRPFVLIMRQAMAGITHDLPVAVALHWQS